MRRTKGNSRSIRGVVFAVVAVCVFCSAASGAPWAGSGVEGDPYLIYDACDMQAIGADSNYWDAHFKLMADIDLSVYTGTSFNIIGDYNNPFTGVFDGNSHSISNFTWKSESSIFVGLFSCIDDPNAEIKDLRLIDPNMQGDVVIGALVGELKNGAITGCGAEGGSVSGTTGIGGLVGRSKEDTLISNCYAATNISGHAFLGGLIGITENGIISSCHSTGNVAATSSVTPSGYIIGGLIGSNYYGTIDNCYATGDVYVAGYGSDYGGLAGLSRGPISNCYATGNVTSEDGSLVGGLVGGNNNDGSILNSHATGNVISETGSYIGGLVGGNDGLISNSYAAGSVSSGGSDIGGLVGVDEGVGLYTISFWDSDVNPDVNGIGNGVDPNVIGKTTAEMKTMSTFTDAGWDFTNIWEICEGTNYPKLVWSIPAADFVCPDGVDFIDFAVLADTWLLEEGDAGYNSVCDISEPDDDTIDILDLEVFTENWLEGD